MIALAVNDGSEVADALRMELGEAAVGQEFAHYSILRVTGIIPAMDDSHQAPHSTQPIPESMSPRHLPRD